MTPEQQRQVELHQQYERQLEVDKAKQAHGVERVKYLFVLPQHGPEIDEAMGETTTSKLVVTPGCDITGIEADFIVFHDAWNSPSFATNIIGMGARKNYMQRMKEWKDRLVMMSAGANTRIINLTMLEGMANGGASSFIETWFFDHPEGEVTAYRQRAWFPDQPSVPHDCWVSSVAHLLQWFMDTHDG